MSTVACTGLEAAVREASDLCPDLVLCDYDLLATAALDDWERHPTLSRVPIVAVSLTRRPDEIHVLDVNGIAGFLYLPTLGANDARRVLGAARPPVTYTLPSAFASQARPPVTPHPR